MKTINQLSEAIQTQLNAASIELEINFENSISSSGEMGTTIKSLVAVAQTITNDLADIKKDQETYTLQLNEVIALPLMTAYNRVVETTCKKDVDGNSIFDKWQSENKKVSDLFKYHVKTQLNKVCPVEGQNWSLKNIMGTGENSKKWTGEVSLILANKRASSGANTDTDSGSSDSNESIDVMTPTKLLDMVSVAYAAFNDTGKAQFNKGHAESITVSELIAMLPSEQSATLKNAELSAPLVNVDHAELEAFRTLASKTLTSKVQKAIA